MWGPSSGNPPWCPIHASCSPWITAIGVIVAIPVIAALGAWSASLVAQRTRAFRGTLAFAADSNPTTSRTCVNNPADRPGY